MYLCESEKTLALALKWTKMTVEMVRYEGAKGVEQERRDRP